MPSTGTFQYFDESNEPWSLYGERMELYLKANKITDDEMKIATFLTLLGPKTYACLRSLVSPAKPAEKLYNERVTILNNHFDPPPSEITERINFGNRKRLKNESVALYVSELRRMARFCNFGTNLDTNLDTMLRDRLIAGIENETIQGKYLLETPDTFTLQKAIDIAISIEATAKNLSSLNEKPSTNSSTTTDQINVLNTNTNHRRRNNFQKNKEGSTTQARSRCFRCGKSDHRADKCNHIQTSCSYCKKIGHLARVCMSAEHDKKKQSYDTTKSRNNKLHSLDLESNPFLNPTQKSSRNTETNEYSMFQLTTLDPAPRPYIYEFQINGKKVEMEHDSGAAYSVMSIEKYNKLKNKNDLPELLPAPTTLRSYTGLLVEVRGFAIINVTFENVSKSLPLLIVSHPGSSLCGRNWIEAFNLAPQHNALLWTTSESLDLNLQKILKTHDRLFSPGLGKIKGVQAHLHLQGDIKPRFYKPRPVPFAHRDKVNAELDRLQSDGIIESVPTSEWAAPIVVVLKQNKNIRICGSFNFTANQATSVEQYPLPKINELFSNLNGGQRFTKLDLRDAYNQIELDEESRNLVVINTQKGLFRYTRLPFGVSSAAAVFQRQMEQIFVSIDRIAIFQDDLLITGRNDHEHLEILEKVLSRLETAGAKLRKEKCEFMASSVEYLGHVLDAKGLHPSQKHLKPIIDAPIPKDVSQLRSFLGLVTYYAKFVPKMSDLLSPLYQLTRKGVEWNWNAEAVDSFRRAKEVLASPAVLVHYDTEKPIILACDASPFGVGAVLSHEESSGDDRPIAFTSRTLNKAEQNYSQIEREALALIFGVTKFRQYLLGRKFLLLTDHSPLATLLSPQKQIPTSTASRIQRWAITLAAYDYEIKFKPGSKNGNADAMSRLPLPTPANIPPQPTEYVMMLETLQSYPISFKDIGEATQSDSILSKVLKFIQDGWPSKSPSEIMKPFFSRRNEFTTDSGIIIWNNRIFIPKEFRKIILEELHDGHFGITKTKRLARAAVWWPNLDSDIENLVASCNECQERMALPPKTTIHGPQSKAPMERVHVDYLGPLGNDMIFVFQDTYSNWIEAVPVKTSTSQVTIEILRDIFSHYGLPICLVTDTGTNFTSDQFSRFTKENGIKHLTIAPYHPPSNGFAEKAVSTIKNGLAKNKEGTMKSRLAKILFSHRRSPNDEGHSPASLFLKRELRSRLDCLRPPPSIGGKTKQPNINKSFNKGDTVWARNFGKGPKWYEGTIIAPIGNAMMSIETPAGNIKRHVNQTRHRTLPISTTIEDRSRTTMTSELIKSPVPAPIIIPQAQLLISPDPVTSTAHESDLSKIRPPQTPRKSSRLARQPTRLIYN